MPEHLKNATKDCTLEVSAEYPTPNRLRLSYRVHNRAARPIYLFNRLYTDILPGKVFAVDPQLAHIRQARHQVVVSKAIVPVPDGLEVEYRYVPCMSKLLPNETFEESFDLALPVSPLSAYTPWLLRADPVASELLFKIGYFVAAPEAENLVREVATPAGPAYRIDPFPLASQQLLSVGPFAKKIAVFTTK
ncbi:MAG: hypothetical protein M3Y54_07850 [Bacteroidota bacterium]|nr:hypothetical protein [Bacteroidota bacterium]